jgi:2,3-dihydroxybiphenyl 1,2-dioxygenase
MTGVSRLGYLGFEVSDVPAWERFLVDMLGLAIAERCEDGSVAFRMDAQARRITVHPGQRDDLAYAGFEVGDVAALRGLATTLSRAGFATADLDAATARARRVQGGFAVADPNGARVEGFHGPDGAAAPFVSPLVPSGFVTGDEGLGHLVLASLDPPATERFYCELLGMRLSDRIEAELAPGFALQVTFLHCNPRHHTLAFAAAPMPKQVHHFMVEVGAMDDVGHAYDRCLRGGIEIANTLGVHPNDRMFSFYARTPSGFDVEFGWGGRKIDDATWTAERYDTLSVWGHHMPGALPANSR